MKDVVVFAASESAEEFTKEICNYLNLEMGKVNCQKFQNDNNFVQILETVREKDVFVVQTTEPPVNERIMEMLIMVDAIKRAAAKRITLVLPYYIYSRTDKKDQPRVPVTAKLLAQLIEAAGVSRVITCDLHNPAIQAYFNINCDVLTGQSHLQKYFDQKNIENKVVVATDAGSSKKAYKYAKHFNCPIALIDKRRDGNNDKAIASNVIGDIKGKNALIFDDEVDTAGSIMETIRILKEAGAKDIYVGCTHGVLSGPAIERINNSELKELVMTNTIPLTPEKKSDKIVIVSLSELFGEAIKRINEATSIGELFE
ncbi:MAG: ribose-phosphate pyrophosphokinase [Clostridia bacterium]|nr:ribose-phosphate pyrophosphokinase [Clostridia bacterium]